MGWTHLFDPTPPATSVATGGSAVPDETPVTAPITNPGGTEPATTAPPVAAPGSTGDGATVTTAPPSSPSDTAVPSPATPEVSTQSSSDAGTSPWLVVVIVVAAVAACIVAYVALVTWVATRRRAARRAGTPTAAVQGAWDEALDQLRTAGVRTDPALTPIEVARTIPPGAPSAVRPLGDLARRYTVARYSADP